MKRRAVCRGGTRGKPDEMDRGARAATGVAAG